MTIDAEKGQTANVTLDNVNIDASDTNKAAVSTNGVVSIELDGNNTLQGGDGHAALEKRSNAVTDKDGNTSLDNNLKLTITDNKNNDGTDKTGAKTDTTGSLTATGGDGGAGIGGGKGDSTKLIGNFGGGNASSIIISGSNTTVIAKGTGGGAGIGGGLGDDANLTGQGLDITIKDGAHVSATGSAGGAGIGGGKGTATSMKNGDDGVIISGGNVTANGGKGAAGIGSGKDSGWALGSHVRITGGTVKATGGAGKAAGIGAGENDAGDPTVTINTTTGDTIVDAITKGRGAAIGRGDTDIDLTMAMLQNLNKGVVRFFHNRSLYNTVHNGKYVGMADNNADEHEKTDAHIWGDTEIIKRAAPDEQGILRHHCAVPGCKGYYDEPYDYVEPDDGTPTTPDVKPDTPAAPDAPVQDVTPGTADTTPADGTVLPGGAQVTDAPDAAADTTVTPASVKKPAVQSAKTLPQTGSNWLAVLGTALSGAFLMATGFFLDRKRGENR